MNSIFVQIEGGRFVLFPFFLVYSAIQMINVDEVYIILKFLILIQFCAKKPKANLFLDTCIPIVHIEPRNISFNLTSYIVQ